MRVLKKTAATIGLAFLFAAIAAAGFYLDYRWKVFIVKQAMQQQAAEQRP